MDEQKNMILAAVLSFAVIAVWFILFPPESPQPVDQTQISVERQATAEGGPAPEATAPVDAPTREAALERSPRVQIRSDRLSGSIALRGGRIDDLHLTDYHETIEPESPTVTLLSPVGAEHPFYAVYGWLPAADSPAPTPGPNTEWTLAEGEILSPDSPITLTWDNGAGLIFTRKISVDHNYMFTVEQSVENATDQPVTLAPYGYVARRGEPRRSASTSCTRARSARSTAP